jgi:methyl-accepting chemotaxis protein
MKRTIRAVALLAVTAFLVAGCGKSADQKKLEADLNAEIGKLHEYQMAMIEKIKVMSADLDGAVATFDSLAKARPKETAGRTADDMKAAKEKLTAVQTAMDAWMATYKPVDENMNHAEALVALAKNKADLTKTTGDALEAMKSAAAALENHKTFAADLMAKATKKFKK